MERGETDQTLVCSHSPGGGVEFLIIWERIYFEGVKICELGKTRFTYDKGEKRAGQ